MTRFSLILALALLLPAAAPGQPLQNPPVEQATVETLGADAIAAELKRQLGDRMPAGAAELDLDNRGLRFAVPSGAPATVGVDGLTYDAQSGRFSAYVAVPADGEHIRVTGRVYRLVELPVLTRPVAPGEVIAANDVETIAVRSDRLTQVYVLAAGELAGKTPRRGIRPGEPVRPSDIQTPIAIHKNELVTVVLQTRGMTLTVQVKALEDGARGSAIRLVNTRSGRTLDAVVTGPATAALVMPALVAAQ